MVRYGRPHLTSAEANPRASTVRLADATFDDTLPSSTDLRLSSPTEPLEVRFVRIVKVDGP